ncbi:MAG: nuclear transport factor 2 family protein [Actinomycetota bacterium]|nr:nuclear transport factor 2 family protein [Actinomycetota bacterium]
MPVPPRGLYRLSGGSPNHIRDFVEAVSSADGEAAGLLVTENAQFRLPGDHVLPPGQAGARAFAAQHAESNGSKPSVELLGAEPTSSNRWLASLRFSSLYLETDETSFDFTVGSLFTLDGDRISAVQAFPSYE